MIDKGRPGSLDYFFMYGIVNAESEKKLLKV